MPRPRSVLSFDIFNTLITPRAPVLEQYVAITSKYGLRVSLPTLETRFPTVFKALRKEFPNYGKHYGINQTEWWEELIRRVYFPEKVPVAALSEMIHAFESEIGYGSYWDVERVLAQIQGAKEQYNVLVVAASNGEPRIVQVLESLGLSKFIDHVYLSYDMEKFKPESDFFTHIFADLKERYPESHFCKSRCWHIGDEFTNDLSGAFNAGWNGVLIDRAEEFQALNPEGEHQWVTSKMVLGLDKAQISRHGLKVKQIGERKYVTNGFDGVWQILMGHS